MKKRKDHILKKFVYTLVFALCVFALAAGARTAYERTSSQLSDKRADKIYENDVMEYVGEKIFSLI